MILKLNGVQVAVRNISEAAEVLAKWRDDGGFGASDFHRETGDVLDEVTRRLLGRISYNGKIWIQP